MHTTKLYHCTDFNSLCSILKSGVFWPSYCYEKAEYLKEPEDFAFAMVCFADLMKNEVKHHLKKFNKDCYIQMSKSWGRHNALSNVIYYGKPSVVSSTFSLLLDDRLVINDDDTLRYDDDNQIEDKTPLRWWRMPSSSRAYPMKLEKKAEYYRLLF